VRVTRTDVLAYASRFGVEFIEDPTNSSRRFLRNRVRIDLLPAMRAVDPDFDGEILRLSRESADLRIRLDDASQSLILDHQGDAVIRLDRIQLVEFGDESLAIILPALMAKAGITLDRRGLVRLASVVRATAGTRGQISGGFEAVCGRDDLSIVPLVRDSGASVRLRPSGETWFGRFRFEAESSASLRQRRARSGELDHWRLDIPRSTEPVIRQWHAGDRLTTDLMGGRRRVKRFFADAGIVGPLRIGWPVVVCGEEVVWIPGVRASQSSIRTEAKMVHYKCERVRD
jgi:tRNA(Ile)-lysidine synthetase-like protein